MINVSSEFISTMQERTDFRCHAEITLTNGTVLEPTDDDFCIGRNGITDGAGCNGFPLGIAISRSITIELINDEGQYADVDFFGAKIRLYLTFALSQTTERVEMGTFTVIDPEDYGSTVKITAVDGMYRADRPWKTSLTYPTTIGAMYREICDACDISVGSARFRNDGFVVDAPPEGDFSYRQMMGFIAMIAVGNARISRLGYMEILPYNQTATAVTSLSDWASPLKVDTDDIVITGISAEQQTDGESVTIMSGIDGYVLSVENPLCSDKRELVGLIAGVLVGFSFRKFDGDYIANPLIEAQDVVNLIDRKGNVYRSVVTDISFVFSGMTTFCNSADSVVRNGAKTKYATPESKASRVARKLVEQEKSAREQAIEQLQTLLEHGSGMYSTDALQPDGSIIRYLHDKPTLGESTNVIKIGSDAIGFSTDGGETYPYGIAVNGDTITRILSAIGIQADWVKIHDTSIETYFLDNGFRNLLPNAKAMQDYRITGSGTIELNSEGIAIASWPLADEVALRSIRNRPAIDFEPLRGKTVTLSWWARSADYAAINAASDQGLAYQFGLALKGKTTVKQYRYRGMYTEQLSAEWQRYSVTMTLDEAFFSSGASCWNEDCDLFIDVFAYTKYRCEITKPLLNFGTTPAYFDDAESAAAIAAAQAAAAAAQEQLNAFSAATTNTLADMQNQIDGSIVTWYENYDPTTSNAPANTWTTAALKKKHLGDLFYNSTTGHAFRWQNNGTAYEWKLIPDTDATKALADAAKAQDTADGKRRVFYTTPTPPYDKGDLWAGGATGDLKVCNTAKASGKTYAASDWALATKYTDDALAQAAMAAFDNMEVGGRNIVKTSNPFYVSPAVSPNAYVNGETLVLNYEDSSIDTYFELRLWENLVANQEYTLSFDCRGVEDGKVPSYFISGASNSTFELFNGRVAKTFVLSADKTSPYLLLDDAGKAPTNTNIILSKVKLEIGNVPSDWSPAPEDVDARIDEVVSTTKEYAAGIVNDSQSVILEAMSKYTEQAAFSSYQEEMASRLNVLNSGIEARVSRSEINEITNAQGDVERRVQEIEDYVRLEPGVGLTLGQKGSNVKQVLDNDSQKILVNGQVMQELNAEEGAMYSAVRIRELLTLGDLIITVETDGSLTGRRST